MTDNQSTEDTEEEPVITQPPSRVYSTTITPIQAAPTTDVEIYTLSAVTPEVTTINEGTINSHIPSPQQISAILRDTEDPEIAKQNLNNLLDPIRRELRDTPALGTWTHASLDDDIIQWMTSNNIFPKTELFTCPFIQCRHADPFTSGLKLASHIHNGHRLMGNKREVHDMLFFFDALNFQETWRWTPERPIRKR